MRNQTASRQCRFLRETDLDQLFETFNDAFSDYTLPSTLTEPQFHQHLDTNAVDVCRSVGCFEGDKMIGFSLNGFGEWNGLKTVYDAGTGVIPDKRRQGISTAMFDLMLPAFKAEGVEQFLLEVITTNEAAVNLYKKLGFEIRRELVLLKSENFENPDDQTRERFDLCEILEADWPLFESFWDAWPSWQNSPASIGRVPESKRIVGAFSGDVCVGYVIYSKAMGGVAQLAVDRAHRNQGIATMLLAHVHNTRNPEHDVRIVNSDTSLTAAMQLFASRGFVEVVRQFEMIKPLS
ncbi:MAG: GNAT family N-acetyltransferase [Pyrinomonadaceae bacterium]